MKYLLFIIMSINYNLSRNFVSCLSLSQNSLINTVKAESEEFLDKIKNDLKRDNDDYTEFNSSYIYSNVTTPALTPSPHNGQESSTNDIHVNIKSPYASDNETRRLLGIDNDTRRKTVNISIENTINEEMYLETSLELDNTTEIKMTKRRLTHNRFNSSPSPRAVWNDMLDAMTPKVMKQPTDKPLLTADQLDMSPAKGARVDKLRMRNHFCALNVLIPEGPKYDSRGKVYLRAYQAARNGVRRRYNNTKPPSLLLPKCCNCCRKSVLGCE